MLPARMATAKMLTARIRWRSEIRRIQPCRPESCRSLLAKTVSDPIEGFDRTELAVDCAKLAAHALDVAVDGAIVDIDVVLIGDVHQLVARFDHAGPLGERLQDQEFGHRQSHIVAVPADPMPRRIHDQAAARDFRSFGLVARSRRTRAKLGPAQYGADAREE